MPTMAAAIAALPLRHRRQTLAQRHGLRWSLVLGLVLALQFMQMLGLWHGIAHAGWPPALVHGAQESINAALFDYIADDDDAVPTVKSASVDVDGAAHPQSVQGTGHHHHSCVEYDAAAGTAGVHVSFFVPALLPGTSVLSLWQAFASWDASFVRHFSSRAPPC